MGQASAGRVAVATPDELYAFWAARNVYTRVSQILRFGQNLIIRRPTQYIKIASAVNPTLPRVFPFKGTTGTVVSVDNTPAGISVNLDTTIPSGENYTNLLFMPMGGAAVGRGAIITGWDTTGGIRQAQFPDVEAWPGGAVPAAGDPYEILVPGLFGGVALVKGEINSTAETSKLVGKLLHYDYGIDGDPAAASPTWREPIITQDDLALSNHQDTTGASESGYSHCGPEALEVQGGNGVQVLVKSNPGGVAFSLWAFVG